MLLCLRPHAAIYAVYVWQADEFDGPDELMTLSEEVEADYSNTVRSKMEGLEAGAQVLSLLTLLVQKYKYRRSSIPSAGAAGGEGGGDEGGDDGAEQRACAQRRARAGRPAAR